MPTTVIKGKKYEILDHYLTKVEAKKSAKRLNGRIHTITGKVTRTAITAIPKTKNTAAKYAVWTRKEEQ